MPITLDGTNGLTTPTYNGADTSEYVVPVTAFKNRIINGAMMIDQRNAGASVSTSSGTSGTFQQDRWKTFVSGTMVVTSQQSSTAPAGFVNSIAYTVSTADASIAAGDLYVIEQPIEGLNVSDFGFGTANATTVTLSFWVRSSIAGTYCGSITNSAENRAYIFSYSISSANTWEQKTITIVGDTSGTWLTTNGIGLRVRFTLSAGSTFQGTANTWSASNVFATSSQTQFVSTSGATFYITGVQLEKGSTATSFDYRPYGTELALCQRYCYVMTGYAYQRFGVAGWTQNATTAYVNAILPVSTRSPAAISVTTSAMSGFKLASGTTGILPTAIALDVAALNIITLLVTFSGGGTTGAVANLYSDNSASATITISSEL